MCRIKQRQFGEMRTFLVFPWPLVYLRCINLGKNYNFFVLFVILGLLFFPSSASNFPKSLVMFNLVFNWLCCVNGRPQPSWDRTCTAGAAIGLLSELQLLPEFSSFGFDKQAEALEDTLVILLEALTTRRVRMGRSITRKVRHMSGIC